MLKPTDRTSSPLVANAFRGAASADRGSSPRNLVGGHGTWVLLQGFYRGTWSVGMVRVPTGIGNIPAGFGDARATGTIRGWCIPGGVAMRRAPEPRPIQGNRGELFDLFLTCPRRPSTGRRVRFPQPPSIGSRIADSSLSC
jgi:hypothetical protein